MKRHAATLILVVLTLAFATSGLADESAKLYDTKCATCHAKDGSGSTPMGKKLALRDLRSADVQKQTDDQLTAILTKGKGKMPAYETKLKPEEIKGLVAYIRQLAKK